MPTHDSAGTLDNLLSKFLSFLHYDRRVRIGVGILIVGALLYVAGRSVYGLIPRYYTLTITGGDIVGNRHFFARVLQSEAHKKNLTLIVRPEEGSLSALRKVSGGDLDVAFIQGGLAAAFPNVEHAATIAPEQVHLLVRRGIRGMEDLRGKSVNLGSKDSIERDVALTIMRFVGYEEDIDYVEANYNPEQLLSFPDNEMPDAMFIISSIPSYLVEILVRDRNFDLLEIPFPESLALRYGWAANSRILSYTYNLDPPVPEKTIQTVAVNVHLVANSKVDPQAISRLLEVLYSPSVTNRIRQTFDQTKISVPSGYPISRGMTSYLTRNEPIINQQIWNKMVGIFGILMSIGGTLIVSVKWFNIAKGNFDGEYLGYLRESAAVARIVFKMESENSMDIEELKRLRDRLGDLRATLIERYPGDHFKDQRLFDRCMSSARAVHDHINRMLYKGEHSGPHFLPTEPPGPPS